MRVQFSNMSKSVHKSFLAPFIAHSSTLCWVKSSQIKNYLFLPFYFHYPIISSSTSYYFLEGLMPIFSFFLRFPAPELDFSLDGGIKVKAKKWLWYRPDKLSLLPILLSSWASCFVFLNFDLAIPYWLAVSFLPTHNHTNCENENLWHG